MGTPTRNNIKLNRYPQTVSKVSSFGGVLNIDASTSWFDIVLTENITAVNILNSPLSNRALTISILVTQPSDTIYSVSWLSTGQIISSLIGDDIQPASTLGYSARYTLVYAGDKWKLSIDKEFNTPVYLLDAYPNAAAAYSLRKLKSGVTYGIKVRRSSDNATTDVELYDVGSIDLSSTVSAGGTLGTWVGSNNAKVDTWYDQMGSYDITQATTSDQPLFINAGSLITKNSLSAFDFNGTSHHLFRNGITEMYIAQPKSIFTVSSVNTSDHVGTVLCQGLLNSNTISNRFVLYRDARTTGGIYRNIIIQTTVSRYDLDLSSIRGGTSQFLQSVVSDGSLYTPYDNGVVGSSAIVSGTIDNSYFMVGVQFGKQTYLDGKVQEIIIFSDDKTTDRSSIETDINNYYSIY